MPEDTSIYELALAFAREHWTHAIEILILGALIYLGHRQFRATRGARILLGLVVLLLALTLAANFLRLEVIGWLVQRLSFFLAIGLVVIFQPELRRGLAELGSSSIFQFGARKTAVVERLGGAVGRLSNGRIGALIAVEQTIDLKSYAETGIGLDADFSEELVLSIFQPKAALHDGGLILDQGRIKAAGCVFPVSQRELSDRSLGLRHRAAIGLSEETDAIVVVVSEETGDISLAYGGTHEQDLSVEEMGERIREILDRRRDNPQGDEEQEDEDDEN